MDYFGRLGVGSRWIGVGGRAIPFERIQVARPSGNIERFAIRLAAHIGTTKL